MTRNKNTRAYLVVLGAFLINGVTAGVLLNALGTLLTALSAKVNSDVATVGLYLTFLSAVGAVMALLAPTLMKKMKLTTIISIGSVCAILGVLMIAWAKNITMVYIAGALCGVATTFNANPLLMPVMNRWFMYNRGTVASIQNAGEWVFTTIFSYIIAYYLSRNTFEPVLYICAIVMAVLYFFSTYVLVKGFPEDLGLKPVGYDKYMEEYNGDKASDEMPGLTRAEIFKKVAYWLFIGVTVLVCCAPSVYNGQRATIFRLAGMTEMQVATLVSVYAAAKTIWRLVSGILADRTSLMFSGIITFIMGLAGMFCFINASSYTILMLGAIFCGGALGFPSILCSLGTGLLVGQKSQKEVGTISFATTTMGVVIGPLLFKLVYTDGNMTPAMILAIVLWAICTILFVFCFAKRFLVENDGRRKAKKIEVKND